MHAHGNPSADEIEIQRLTAELARYKEEMFNFRDLAKMYKAELERVKAVRHNYTKQFTDKEFADKEYVDGYCSDFASDYALALYERDEARKELAQAKARKDGAYLERNRVVAALAQCFPAGVAKTAIEGWDEEWHGCVYIDLPTGQVSWHYHDSHAYLFEGLPSYMQPWDGHDTEEKYRRVAQVTRAQAKAREARLRDVVKSILGWREHDRREGESPIALIEDLARQALTEAQEGG